MHKSELADRMKDKLGTTKGNAELAIKAFTEVITEELVKGEKVSLTGFATFETVNVPERERRNPKNGVVALSPAHKKVRIKIGKSLKDAINGK